MKYLGLIFFAALLIVTRSWTHQAQSSDQEFHSGVQSKLKGFISDYIQQNLPKSKNLKFEKFWTEPVSDVQIKAMFSYSFEDENETDGTANIFIDGAATLNRIQNQAGESVWSFDELQILNNTIDFKDGILIRPGDEDGSTQK